MRTRPRSHLTTSHNSAFMFTSVMCCRCNFLLSVYIKMRWTRWVAPRALYWYVSRWWWWRQFDVSKSESSLPTKNCKKLARLLKRYFRVAAYVWMSLWFTSPRLKEFTSDALFKSKMLILLNPQSKFTAQEVWHDVIYSLLDRYTSRLYQ